MCDLDKKNYKAFATARAKSKLQNGLVIKTIVKTSAKSEISQKDAIQKANEKAKAKVLKYLKSQTLLSNSLIQKISDSTTAKTFYNCTKTDFSEIKPLAIGSPTGGYSPAQLKSIYNVQPVVPANNIRKVSITIVIAYHYANLQNDFNTFCSKFGLPACKLNIYQLGNKSNPGWGLEECLDVQWSYAINPNATINVVEAASASYSDLFSAIQYANTKVKSDIISMSWGGLESSSQTLYDKYFNNTSICYLAASGDSNSVSYPATSPNVIACGGTTLNSTSPSYNNRSSETTWTSAGCGVSVIYNKPSYQSLAPNFDKYTKRVIPDISGIANPSTGVQVCCTGYKSRVTWLEIGGTSLSCPVNAALLSLSIQKRLNAGKPAITSAFQSTKVNLLQNYLYKNLLYSQKFYDVSSGVDGIYTAGSGVDVPTGLGVPQITFISNDIVNF